MLKQQQAAQAAAAGGGGGAAGPPQQHMLPTSAISASDVSALDEADRVARLTALQVGAGPQGGQCCCMLLAAAACG